MKDIMKPSGYIGKILQPEERIIHQANVHWVVYFPAMFCLIVGIVLISKSDFGTLTNIFGIVFLAIMPISWIPALIRRYTTELVITDRRVIVKIGFISRKTWEINRNAIEGVEVDQPIFGRILNFGTITVRGRGEGSAPIKDVEDPITFRNHVPLG